MKERHENSDIIAHLNEAQSFAARWTGTRIQDAPEKGIYRGVPQRAITDRQVAA
jgi:hypothetical protein